MSEEQDEEAWLDESRRSAVEVWSYEKSSVRPGARPRLIWHEFPLAAVWVVAVTGRHESEHGVAVYCGDAPMTASTGRRSVAEVLELAARNMETAARRTDRDRPSLKRLVPTYPEAESTQAWREHARRLRERAGHLDVRALAIVAPGEAGTAELR